nr:WUSCHEL-related homeobox 9-like isoform X1 [Ipomoea batatas]
MSSNKHWPSLFRSKPSGSNQRQHDSNSSRVAGGEERTPEPKPRWNPKPEQIRILESLFNSGVVNPSREEIRRIRLRLEEYGEVGDANVFYWFQNRKSRSKNKQRQLHIQNAMAAAAAAAVVEPQQNPSPPPPPPPPAAVTFLGNNPIMIGTSSSSSSSDNSADHLGLSFFTHSPSSVNQQTLYQAPPPNDHLLPEPYYYPQPQNTSGGASFTQGFFLPDSPNVPLSSDLTIGNSSGILPTEFMGFNPPPPPSKGYDNEGINLDLGYGTVTSLPTTTVTAPNAPLTLLPPPSTTVPSTLYHFQGLGDANVDARAVVEQQKATLLINGIPFDVAAAAPFDVRGTFGDESMLVNCYSGQALDTNEWGITVQSLQPGAVYYLVRSSRWYFI